ncbi:hypothetical protein Tco_1029569 [Tanacetum coccineum]|uniref:Retrotransposon gag domain-containing protein n=1 Tax=Tanacetum coccineum TaxID=301880 RepID=A0ABQ5G5C4_9ASTR
MDMYLDDEIDEAEVISPYEEVDPLNPPPPSFDSDSEDVVVLPSGPTLIMPPRRMSQAAIKKLIFDKVAEAIAADQATRGDAGGPARDQSGHQLSVNTEMVFSISECVEGNKVNLAAATLQGRALTWEEIQRMEQKLWNLKVKDYNISAYTHRFNELALLCPTMVEPEHKKILTYIREGRRKGEIAENQEDKDQSWKIPHLLVMMMCGLYHCKHTFFQIQGGTLSSILMEDVHLDTIPSTESDKKERRIAENQAAKDRYWKIPICYDDDEDYTIAITPILSTKEAIDSLIMEDEHLDTIPATESDKVIKSSIENLVSIPSEFKGISEDTCDAPVCEDPSTFDALSNHSEILSDSNNDGTSSDDDSYENIEYIEASPLNLEYDSLEEVNEDQEEKDRLVTNIESLKNNPTPDRVLKFSSSFPIPVVDCDSFFEESDTSLSHLDNSLPEFETFSDHTEETRSGSTTTHANNSLPEYDSFLFEVEPDQGGLTGIVISDNLNNPLLELPEFESFHFDLDPSFPRPPPEPPDVEISLIIETDAPVINNFDELNEDECFDPGGDEINVEDDDSFIFVIRTFLPFLTYPMDSPFLCSFRNEDTIYDPGIST